MANTVGTFTATSTLLAKGVERDVLIKKGKRQGQGGIGNTGGRGGVASSRFRPGALGK